MNTVEFMENFIKESIIKEFAARMVLAENKHIEYVRGLSDPIITFCENDENSKKFALTNVAYWQSDALHGEMYSISGIVYNNAKIGITEHVIQNI